MTQKKVNLTHENIVIKFVQFNLFLTYNWIEIIHELFT